MRWLIIILISLLLIGCSDSLTGEASSDVPQDHITITKYSYDPIVLYTKTGTKVTWTNKDSEPHTVTILGTFDSGVLGRRHTFSYTFDKPGTYSYSDLFNQERIAKVVVR